MDSFVHLDVQSAYSFLWGTFHPSALVDRVRAMNQEAVALTDIWGLYGAMRFYPAALKAGIQPLLGVKARLWDETWVTLLARDLGGYRNLCRLLSEVSASARAPGGPHLSPFALDRHGEGIICLAGVRGPEPRGAFDRPSPLAAVPVLAEAFPGPDQLFVALENHDLPGDRKRAEEAAAFARRAGLPTVAAHAVAFLLPDDYLTHWTLVGIQEQHHHRAIRPLPNDRFALAPGAEMARRLPFPEALANTGRIADMCRGLRLPLGRLHPPRFRPRPEADRALARRTLSQLARRHPCVPPRHIRKLDEELQIVAEKGMSDFFLLVEEVGAFAKAKGIRHSVRGSASGSLVVHLLLGGVDPLAHDLLFERFINEGRGDMPDVDIDFDSERRDEVIAWLMGRFPDQTAIVATIHTFRVRSAVRLAAKALGFPLDEIARLSSCLPWGLRGIALETALETLPELSASPLKRYPDLVRLASRLYGLPFQASVHLGGVLLTPDDVSAWTPVGPSAKGFRVGQLDKDDIETLGLLKLDLLGLRMHTALRKAEEFLRSRGQEIALEALPLDDPDAYALLRTTDSLGVFQLESPGQRHLLGRLQPERFGDLVAEISLFRPGPVSGNMVPEYVLRRTGKKPQRMPHPDLAPVLEETFGVIVFQEQVLRVVHAFAGLSYADADAFRRAMTKRRSPAEMEGLKQAFFEGARRKGHAPKLIEAVYEQVAAFAAFGFCKAHAVAFAHITYQSAWLKAHHPQAFYLGLLNAGHVGSYPPSVLLNEARRRGMPILPPHVNASGIAYRAEGGGIRVPLGVIRGIGPAMATRIVRERTHYGPFRSWEDLFRRVPLPKHLRTLLVLAGALEGLASTSSPEGPFGPIAYVHAA